MKLLSTLLGVIISFSASTQFNVASTQDNYINGYGSYWNLENSSNSVVKNGRGFLHVMVYDGGGPIFAWDNNGTSGKMPLGNFPGPLFNWPEADLDVVVTNISGHIVAFVVQSVMMSLNSNQQYVIIRSTEWDGTTFLPFSSPYILSLNNNSSATIPHIDHDDNGQMIVSWTQNDNVHMRTINYATSAPFFNVTGYYNVSNMIGLVGDYKHSDIAINPSGVAAILVSYQVPFNHLNFAVYQFNLNSVSNGTLYQQSDWTTCIINSGASVLANEPRIAKSSDPNLPNDFSIVTTHNVVKCWIDLKFVKVSIYHNGVFSNGYYPFSCINSFINTTSLVYFHPSIEYCKDVIELTYTYVDMDYLINPSAQLSHVLSQKFDLNGQPIYPNLSCSLISSDISLSQTCISNTTPKKYSDQDDFYYAFYMIDDRVAYKKSSYQNVNLRLQANSSGSESVVKNYSLKIFPNPASSDVVLSTVGFKCKELVIYNTYGVVVKKVAINGNSTLVDISNLSSGLYFVEAVLNRQKIISKFVKK